MIRQGSWTTVEVIRRTLTAVGLTVAAHCSVASAADLTVNSLGDDTGGQASSGTPRAFTRQQGHPPV